MLAAALQIEVGAVRRPVVADERGPPTALQHEGVGAARIEPDVENVDDALIIGGVVLIAEIFLCARVGPGVSPSVSKLDRNRVDVTLTIKEGKAAKIRHINLVGNEKFEQEDLTDSWESAESNWLSWYRRDDQYSREKLSGDRKSTRLNSSH